VPLGARQLALGDAVAKPLRGDVRALALDVTKLDSSAAALARTP
jgi:hypothetical protein